METTVPINLGYTVRTLLSLWSLDPPQLHGGAAIASCRRLAASQGKASAADLLTLQREALRLRDADIPELPAEACALLSWLAPLVGPGGAAARS